MSMPPMKIIARNAAAMRRAATVTGNPVSTRLESGVGNCFPGLECDLRNLERRFFPFVEVDFEEDDSVRVAGVDLAGAEAAAQAGGMPVAMLALYRRLAKDVAARRRWLIAGMTGIFGSLGQLTLNLATLRTPSAGPNRRPPDPWTAVRMLTEGTNVVINLHGPGDAVMQLNGARNRYLDDNGALAGIFVPGEMTQSLCSPWTHDFRDCGCYYWASNHPDIAQPPLPTPIPGDPAWNAPVIWERQDRTLGVLPPPATAADPAPQEMRHQEINMAWQSLNFVVGRRELVGAFTPRQVAGNPLSSPAELAHYLRYSAGVELAVAQQYLTAAYSLKPHAGLPAGLLRDDVRAAHAELMRIAVGEMRHLRAVNEVLRALLPVGTAFNPALRVADRLPADLPGTFRPVTYRAATEQAIREFIDIEAPSVSVDSVYARILATLERDGPHEAAQSVRTIMAEGEDHFETFRSIQVWLGRHSEPQYLRATSGAPPPGDADRQQLQARYLDILEQLHTGYTQGGADGAPEVNMARMDMVGPLDALAHRIADRGFLVIFDTLADPRFAPISPPP
jgi:hypothetical protein